MNKETVLRQALERCEEFLEDLLQTRYAGYRCKRADGPIYNVERLHRVAVSAAPYLLRDVGQALADAHPEPSCSPEQARGARGAEPPPRRPGRPEPKIRPTVEELRAMPIGGVQLYEGATVTRNATAYWRVDGLDASDGAWRDFTDPEFVLLAVQDCRMAGWAS
jgi:hypothetical protein